MGLLRITSEATPFMSGLQRRVLQDSVVLEGRELRS